VRDIANWRYSSFDERLAIFIVHDLSQKFKQNCFLRDGPVTGVSNVISTLRHRHATNN
jgi:hypothetical protein